MGRSAKKCEKDEKTEKIKLKKVSIIIDLWFSLYTMHMIGVRPYKRGTWKEQESMQRMPLDKRIR